MITTYTCVHKRLLRWCSVLPFLKRYGVLHPYPLHSLWHSSPGWIRNFPVDVTASRFLWDFCKIPQKSSFFVIFGLATTVVACATQPQIEDLFLDF